MNSEKVGKLSLAVALSKESFPRRINVVGNSASGKSTFSRQLASKLGADYIELDALMWGRDWTATPDPAFFALIERRLSESESWVLDGNYSRSTPIKWKNVEMVIWIDLPFWLNLYQSVTRAVRRIWTQQELWPGTGNVETLRMLFNRDSVVLWMITNHRRKRREMKCRMDDEKYDYIEFVHLRSRRSTRKILDSI